MPGWLQIELALLPIVAGLLGSIIGGLVRFARLDAKVSALEKELGNGLAARLDKLDETLDGVGQRLAHIEGYMQKAQEG